MVENNRGLLGENPNRRNWFVYGTVYNPATNVSRIVEASSLCPDDFLTKDEFWVALSKLKSRFSEKFGWENVSTGSGTSFISFISGWADEITIGGRDN